MNRIYRLVFNRALRVWQVASEQVRRPAGSALRGADAGPMRVSCLCWALCYVLGGVCVSTAAHAQSLGRIVADPTAPGAQRPTVLNAGNGVPLVNITTPSAAGVSRNTYSQFDVGGQGAILNNSPVQSQTQLGGWVQGNPWLSTGAKVILNEVNGPVSHLGGYVEVAGARAEVVIANPAGIQVDGGGFLNASRVTLTTGTPIVTNGALDGYRVSGGTIQITGAGLDSRGADYTGLLARAVQINAGIWANQVQAVLGSNVVSADQRQITAQAASGAAPAFALDVGALGGMFANKIWLIGNEHGVGVRNAGNLGAQAGELVVTVDGRLENSGALQSQQDTQLAASGGIANAGVVSAGGTLQVNTAAEIDNSGGTLNAQRLQLAAAALRNQGGKIEQTGLQALGVNAGSLSNRAQGSLGTVAADAQGTASGSGNGAGSGSGTGAGNGQSSAGGSAGNGSTTGSTSGQSGGQTNSTLLAPGLLTIAGALDNDGGRIEGAGPIAVSVAAGLDNSAGRLGVAALNVRGDLINRAGTLAVYGDADLQVGALVNDQGHLDVANALGLNAASLSNQGGSLRHGGSDASAWHVQGLLDNTGGVLSSNAAAWQLDAQTVVNVNGHITHSGTQGLTLTAQDWSGAGGQIATPGALVWRAGTLDHRAATTSASVLDVQADSLDNRGGTLLSTGPQAASVQVSDLLDNGSGGSIASNGDLHLGAGTFGNAGGQVQQAGTGLLQIAAGSLTGSGGRLLSNGGLSLSGGAIDLSGGTTAAQWIGLHADSLSTAGGQLTSLGAQTLALQVQGALNNHGGRLLSNAGINLQAGALDNGGGTLTAAGSADSAIVVSGQLDNTQGTVASNGNRLSIAADQLLNAHGTLSHTGSQGLTLTANGVDNTQGSIVSSAALSLTATTVDQRQGTLGAASVQVQAGMLDNSGGGRIVASGSDASVLHTQTLNNAGGTVASNGDLTLQATTLDNTQGAIQHAGTGQLQITADTLNGSGGSIVSNGTLGISGQSTDLSHGTTSAQTIGIATGTLSTAGGHLTASGTQALNLAIGGTLDNTGGTIAGNGVLAVQAQRLLNAQGSVQAAGQGLSTLHITQDLQNQQGKLLLGGAGQLSAGSLTNQSGIVSTAGSSLQVQVDGALDNHAHGVLSSAGQLALTASTLDNSSTGNVVAGGDLSAQIGGALDNDAGLLQANGAVQLQSAGLSNRAGSVVGGTLSVETQGQALDNSNGTLGSQSGALSVHSGALTNAGGRVQARTDLSVQTDGQAIVNTGSGAAGGLLAGGHLQVDGGSLDNRGGVVFAQGDARLGLSSVDNSAAGSLSAVGNLALNAASLNNAGGRVQGGQSLALALSGDVNNQAGLLASNGLLSLTAATLDNRNTFTAGNTLGVQAGQLQLQAQALNNQQGQLLSNGSSSVQMSTALDNSGGQIAAAGSLTTQADAVTNTGGMLRSQGNQFVAARALSGDGQVQSQGDLSLNLHDTLTNTGQLIANGNLSVHTDGDLLNQGVLRANNLDVSAANVDNAASGEMSSQGVTHVQASGQLTNRGLIDGALTQLQAAILDNVGSGRVYGDHVAIAAGTLLNRAESVAGVTQAGTVAARQRLDIGVGQLSNTDGGLIYSDGDAAIGGALDGNQQASGNANRVDNLGSTIEIAGTLALHASALNNVRQNVVVITKITSRYMEPVHRNAYNRYKPYTTVEHVTQEDVLQPGAGPDAVIHAGGAMHLVTDNLHNTYARIAAGGDLSIDGITGAASVTNLSKTLYRYDDTEYTAYGSSGEDYKTWSDPTIITPIGYVGGSITSGGTLQINVGNLSNLNQGPTAPNVQNATVLENLDVQGDQATIGGGGGGGGAGPLHGPYAVAANGVAQAGVTQHAIDGVNGQGSMTVNAAGGSPDRIVMGAPDTQLPSASLFNVQPNSGHALVETDPRFANYRTWLSSDAQLRQLGYNADTLQQRLGDGYYEQKLVREQIGQLTGRRFLEGYGSDEAQYQALLDAGATVGKAWGLRPGVALTAAQMAQLTSDIVWLVAQTVTLPDGRTTTALVPHVYLRLHPGDLDSGGALLAGANVDAHVSGTLTNNGTIAGRQLVSLDAGRIDHLGGSISGNQVALTSASDIDIHGASVSAVDALSVKAAGNINVTSTVDTLQGGDRHQYATTQIPRVAGLYVTGTNGSGILSVVGGGDVTLQAAQVRNAGTDGVTQLVAGHDLTLGAQTLTHSTDATRNAGNYQRSSETTHALSSVQGAGDVVLAAGHDVTLQAAQIGAGKTLAVQAGHDIDSQAVTDTHTQSSSRMNGRSTRVASTSDEHVQGTQLSAGSDIVMRAGNDLTLASTAVASQNGDIALAAGHDVALTATQEQHDSVVDQRTRKSGFLSSKTTTTHDETHDSLAVTSSLSGDTVHIAAGNDLLSQGAQIVGTGDVVLAAGNNLTLETAQNTHSEEHDSQRKKSGLFGGGGLNFTIGKQSLKTDATSTTLTHTGSTVGSLDGNVTLVAGNTLAISGSDVMALQGDLTAKAKDIAITEVHDTSDSTQKTAFKQGGLTVSVTSAALNLAQGAVHSAQAGSQAKGDARMQALAGASAAYSAYGAGQAMGNLLSADSAKDAAQGAGINIAITVGGSRSHSESTQHSDTSKGSTLHAGGNVTLIATGGGDDSNLLIRGSDVKAGNNLLLAADHDITVESAQDTSEQHSRSKSGSAAIGVGVSYGADGAAMGVTANASTAHGQGDGKDVTQRNSHLSAGNTATIISGHDTTLDGAVLSANRVMADIGGDLHIHSEQDTSHYASHDTAASASVTVGIGASGSASYSHSKVDGDFASVREQSGIQAGDGGFDITVHGNTDLKGAVIASTQAAIDQGRNRLSTGTLTVADITNTSHYSASGVNLSGGYAAGGSNGKPGNDTASNQMPSTVNNGSAWSWQNQGSGARGTAAGYDSKSGSQTSITHGGISGGDLTITDAAGQQARSGQSIADTLAALNRDVHTGDSGNGLVKDWNGQQLQQQVKAGAEIMATFGQQASRAIGDYAEQKTNEAAAMRLQAANTTDPDQKAQLIAQADQLDSQWGANGTLRVLAHTAVGGLTGGVGGAAGAAAGTLTAPAVADALRNAGVTGPLADALTGLASTAAGAVAGGASGAATAGNEVANNYLSHPQRDQKARELRECADEQCRDKVEAKWDDVSLAQSREMKSEFFDSLTPEQQEQLLNLKPGTPEYDALLAAGALQAAAKSPNGTGSAYDYSYQLLTQTDWQGQQAVGLKSMSLEDRNRLEIGVLGPLFGVPGVYATLLGATPEHVAFFNQTGALASEMGTAAEAFGSGVARGGKGVNVETRVASDLDNAVDGPALITSNGQANSASGALYRKDLLASMSKPVVTDPELSSLIDDLYRDGAKIGSGSTADAVRYEMRTGEMVGGRSHSQKAQDYIRALQRWGNENDGNPNISSIDKDYAKKVIEDMNNALKGD